MRVRGREPDLSLLLQFPDSVSSNASRLNVTQGRARDRIAHGSHASIIGTPSTTGTCESRLVPSGAGEESLLCYHLHSLINITKLRLRVSIERRETTTILT